MGGQIFQRNNEEGQKLHDGLRGHVDQLRFCYFHRWRRQDLMMWDNRCLLHRAIPYDYARYRRVLRRTTVAGSGPVIGPFSAGAGRSGPG